MSLRSIGILGVLCATGLLASPVLAQSGSSATQQAVQTNQTSQSSTRSSSSETMHSTAGSSFDGNARTGSNPNFGPNQSSTIGGHGH
ncbi:MAG TPA: hypothetical protein VMF32_09935 [Xanthobacteraceae bacterium]|nr:hypothetical protein [Xanthobacteraceae bacterium]